MWLDGTELVLTASIGISVFPKMVTMPTNCCVAPTLRLASRQGRRRDSNFLLNHFNARAAEFLQLEHSLRRALGRMSSICTTSRKSTCASGQLVGMEALVRWQYPSLGLVAPANSSRWREDTGMIVAIGEPVMLEACRKPSAGVNWGWRMCR